MAIFRKIQVTFWEDSKVLDEMTPEDKYFMLYLLTNTKTKQCGCYEISLRQISIDTGYNIETVSKLIDRFEKILKIIKYCPETKEIYIINWYKYNWTSSPKVLTCIANEAKSIKNKEFRYSIHTLLIQYGYTIHTETQEEQEQEQEEEQEKEKEEKKEQEQKQEKDILSVSENLEQIKPIDPYTSDLIEKVFEIYSKECNNLCPLGGYARKNRSLREAISDYMYQTNNDIEYFTSICKKANELKIIADKKIDLKMILNCYEGIDNGKYIKTEAEEWSVNDLFKKEV